MTTTAPTKRVLLFGATGTAGRAAAQMLVEAGHEVVAIVRPHANANGLPRDLQLRRGHPSDPSWLDLAGFGDETFDAVVSCIASRSGVPSDAWTVDYRTNAAILKAAKRHDVGQMIIVSAICVQRPRLTFQKAKLRFETELISSDLTYSIIRPTAFFKSLTGQIRRVRDGKPYLVFGDGQLTASKPISNRDLGRFVVRCLVDPSKQNAILPIGGPGPAVTPRAVGDMIFRLTRQTPRFREVPPWIMRAVAGGLSIVPGAGAKAELARIGHYYGTESMLVFNEKTGRYDADATPEFGEDRLEDYIQAIIEGREAVDLGEHAVF